MTTTERQTQLAALRAHLDRPRLEVPTDLTPPVFEGVTLCWDARRARLFAADCAERVLPLFEALHPDDPRPRRAIELARAYAQGQATPKALLKAHLALHEERYVRPQAEYAAFSAACAAAPPHPRVAWWASEWAVGASWWAGIDGTAEMDWQAARLAEYLLGFAYISGSTRSGGSYQLQVDPDTAERDVQGHLEEAHRRSQCGELDQAVHFIDVARAIAAALDDKQRAEIERLITTTEHQIL